MTVSTWLRKHEVSPAAYEWAVSSCKTMQEVWDKAKPEWLIWIAFQPGVLDDETLENFVEWFYPLMRSAPSENHNVLYMAKKASFIYECKCILGMLYARCEQSQWLRANAKPNFED
jgi:hypothetical protein